MKRNGCRREQRGEANVGSGRANRGAGLDVLDGRAVDGGRVGSLADAGPGTMCVTRRLRKGARWLNQAFDLFHFEAGSK